LNKILIKKKIFFR